MGLHEKALNAFWCGVSALNSGKITRNLFEGVFSHFFRPFLFSHPFLLFPPIFLPAGSGFWDPTKGFGESLLAPLREGRKTFAATRHIPWALNTPKMRLRLGLHGAHRTCLVAANAVLFLLNEIKTLKQTWLFLNVSYATVAWSRLLNSTWLVSISYFVCLLTFNSHKRPKQLQQMLVLVN